MKYIVILFALFITVFPIMTNSADQENIREIVNANDANYFSITKTQGAFLSFDISSIATISEAENIVLSIFLEDSKNAENISEFLIYPVDRISKKVGDTGLVIKTETRKGNFVDFVIPPKFLEGIKNPLGFVIRSNQESSFVFKGPDGIGTTQDPRLIVEEGHTNISEESFNVSSEQKSILEDQLDRIEQSAKIAAVNSERKWYEKPYFTIPLGLLLGILSSIAYSVLKKSFPFL